MVISDIHFMKQMSTRIQPYGLSDDNMAMHCFSCLMSWIYFQKFHSLGPWNISLLQQCVIGIIFDGPSQGRRESKVDHIAPLILFYSLIEFPCLAAIRVQDVSAPNRRTSGIVDFAIVCYSFWMLSSVLNIFDVVDSQNISKGDITKVTIITVKPMT